MMRLETFRGRDLQRVSEMARRVLGDDVMILRTRTLRQSGEPLVEVVAAAAEEVEALRRMLEPGPLPRREALGRAPRLALVGPTGAGKTTTAAKLAVHAGAFGARRVGFVTLDTYRVGAVEQLGTLAEIAGVPLEVVYGRDEVRDALKRLEGCDVILIDTPGRSPRVAAGEGEWGELLRELRPDEVHLVLPATLRADVADAVRELYAAFGATHLLLSKLDEVPGESGIAALAGRMGLPARWVTDGQEVPADLRPAVARILASGGPAPEGWVE